MSTTATLESPQVRLDAGSEATVPLHIRNNGTIVEGYHLEVVGVPAEWTSVDPIELSLYPGDTTTATLAFRPPRTSSVPAGELPFGIRVIPTERPQEAVVPEGVVEVLPFLETTAELVPRTSHGRRRAKHQVAVDNRGNVPVSVLFGASDPGDVLELDVKPEAMTVDPGSAAFTDVRVRSRNRLWRGTPITHPFSVLVTPHAGQPVTLDGAHLQEPILPKWLGKALAILAAILAILALLWFFVLKPTISSAAKDAVHEPLAKASSQAAAAQKQAAAAQQQAAAAQQQAGKAGQPVAAAPTATSAAPAVAAAPAPVPLSKRIAVQAPAGGTDSSAVSVPAKTTLRLTDLVFENPQGDFGTLTISANGNTLLTLALENFRDTDYHFVSPIEVTAGHSVTVQLGCAQVGVPPAGPKPTSCSEAVLIGGTTVKS